MRLTPSRSAIWRWLIPFLRSFLAQPAAHLPDQLRGGPGAAVRLAVFAAAHPHQVRHACGYFLASKGHGTRAIQGYRGHRDIVKWNGNGYRAPSRRFCMMR